ncbi:glycosyltransferase [Neobacillus drentensis]|jgi:glycosyltransferase involved in cell wall biosynthesis|uniref:glycosyltransferase n=1 Tax=Neobacillus drentensis TaxID=220684 RepID=UPI002FFD7627
MEILLLLICGILLFQFIFVIWNLQQLPKPVKGNDQLDKQTFSILIPARNEAERIGACLESISNQTIRPVEVLVLDDHSTDETKFVVGQWCKKNPTIRLMKGSDLKEGWIGKSFACHQLAKSAKGDWLLFLDADVRLDHHAMEKIVKFASDQKTGMISGFPRQQVFSWLEKIVVPMMMFMVASHLPIRWVRKSNDPRFVAAHGGFICIEASCYQAVGGHERIRNHLVDDMELAKLVKRNGFPFTLASIKDLAYMRMYKNAAEVWEGYRKNIFPGVNRNLWILSMVMFFYIGLYLLPAGVIVLNWNQMSLFIPAFLSYLLAVCIKGWIDYRNGIPWWYGIFVPISVLIILLIGMDSVRMAWTNKGYVWKGRRYT